MLEMFGGTERRNIVGHMPQGKGRDSCGFTLRLMRLQPQAPGIQGAPDEAMIKK